MKTDTKIAILVISVWVLGLIVGSGLGILDMKKSCLSTGEARSPFTNDYKFECRVVEKVFPN